MRAPLPSPASRPWAISLPAICKRLARFPSASFTAPGAAPRPNAGPVPRPWPPIPKRKDLKGSDLYNGMIVPLMPFAIKGVIWYQGESNGGRAQQYRTLFPAMIKNWRDDWKQGDFPFLFVQLAPFNRATAARRNCAKPSFTPPRRSKTPPWSSSPTSAIRTDIHPPDKDPVGARLALCAQAMAYQEKMPYSGPEYTRHEDRRRQGRFSASSTWAADSSPGRTRTPRGSRKGRWSASRSAGADKKFVNAEAVIDGRQDRRVQSQVATPWPSATAGPTTRLSTCGTAMVCRPRPSAPTRPNRE